MAGFLGLGGGEGSVFLDPDDAKSMGDIDYMRTPKKVKRTFAKTKGWGDVGASEKVVSAYDERGGDTGTSSSTPSYQAPATPSYQAPATPSYQAPATPSYQAPATPSYQAPVASESTSDAAPKPEVASDQSSGDGMDMFRSMARKMR